MRYPAIIPVVAALVTFAGCMPAGDSYVRKSQSAGQEGGVEVSGADLGVEAGSTYPELDGRTKNVVERYGPVVRKYADRYGFDWRLILAIMKQESRFSPEALSHRGAFGLMQIMPVTAEEVTRDLDIDDVTHPRNNIRGGVFYLRRLYNLLEGENEVDRLKLTLAAYNAGIGRVYDAQNIAAYMHEDPSKWNSIRESLPLLSKRYYTLHRNIWAENRPPAGWFGNSRETVDYVESVMGYYDEYRALLN